MRRLGDHSRIEKRDTGGIIELLQRKRIKIFMIRRLENATRGDGNSTKEEEKEKM